jgi:membrane protease YdiL (CAAX protease family)
MPGNDSKVESSAPLPILFRHIALLLFGGIIAGYLFGFLIGLGAYGFTRSAYVHDSIGGISIYAALLVGYHWIAQDHSWASVRMRFLSVGIKPLILSALAAASLISFTSAFISLLKWAHVKLANGLSPIELDSRAQLPLAVFAVVLVAPLTEELFFRGLLLDWLRQKMNVWIAAVMLSVIFSLLHNNPFSSGAIGWLAFCDRFLLGMGASALAIKYHSLRPAFVMHATFNAIAGFASVFDGT